MSDKECISSFIEEMDHEFTDYNNAIEIFGYKVDGTRGVKVCCNLNGLKSVDYFYENSELNKFYFIEFSDLNRHKALIDSQHAEVDSVKSMARLTKKKLLKSLSSEIHNELRTKYTDSLHILDGLDHYIKNIPETFFCNKGDITFHIVVPPLPGAADDKNVIDFIKFYDTLKSKVKAVIPSSMISNVVLYPVSKISLHLM